MRPPSNHVILSVAPPGRSNQYVVIVATGYVSGFSRSPPHGEWRVSTRAGLPSSSAQKGEARVWAPLSPRGPTPKAAPPRHAEGGVPGEDGRPAGGAGERGHPR